MKRAEHQNDSFYRENHAIHKEAHDDDSNHHHGHSHLQGKEMPRSVTSVAWMVIMGDGLHNFSDGMAIGELERNKYRSLRKIHIMNELLLDRD